MCVYVRVSVGQILCQLRYLQHVDARHFMGCHKSWPSCDTVGRRLPPPRTLYAAAKRRQTLVDDDALLQSVTLGAGGRLSLTAV